MSVVAINVKNQKEIEKAIDTLSARIGNLNVGIVLATIDKEGNATINILRLTKLEALGLAALVTEMIINTEEEPDG